MAVVGLLSFTLEVPDLDEGVHFYCEAGLLPTYAGDRAMLACQGQDRPSIVLIGGARRKQLHHVQLRAENLEEIAVAALRHGGQVLDAPAGYSADGLWLSDPHGMIYHLCERSTDTELTASPAPFAINEPGRIVRNRRSAVLPKTDYDPVRPLRLGHVLVFTPDVMRSVEFVTEAFGMGLADQAQDIIAFTCARMNSDHHVIAFAKSGGIGLHHGSFQVADPDEVGRGGRQLTEKTSGGDWGFGRHTIGSNFFHYIQDPWGSWFEYYSDMDYIDDYQLWKPTNYAMEDSLASWGPDVPSDFVHNYELD
jgi:catechol 2,3-dioxygenase-like lactoylglutathione lyase family enzyme